MAFMFMLIPLPQVILGQGRGGSKPVVAPSVQGSVEELEDLHSLLIYMRAANRSAQYFLSV